MSARAVAWAVLFAAALLEVVWALALKQPHPGWVSLGIAVALISLGMLSFALRELPVGGAYAVWVGLGAVGVTVVGILLFAEPAGPLRLFFLALILAGVIGLNLPAKRSESSPRSGPAKRSEPSPWSGPSPRSESTRQAGG